MNKERYVKWFLEVSNQEYKGELFKGGIDGANGFI